MPRLAEMVSLAIAGGAAPAQLGGTPSWSRATARAAQGPEDQAEEWQAAPSFIGSGVGGNRALASAGQGTAGVHGEFE